MTKLCPLHALNRSTRKSRLRCCRFLLTLASGVRSSFNLPPSCVCRVTLIAPFFYFLNWQVPGGIRVWRSARLPVAFTSNLQQFETFVLCRSSVSRYHLVFRAFRVPATSSADMKRGEKGSGEVLIKKLNNVTHCLTDLHDCVTIICVVT